MVKKLLHHELRSYWRTWLIIQIIVLCSAGSLAFFSPYNPESLSAGLIMFLAFTTFGIAALVSIGFVWAYGIIRFYRNLFGAEGYLTLTLPVSTSAHIIVKLLGNMIYSIGSALVILLSLCIIIPSNMLVEFFAFLGDIIPEAVSQLGVMNVFAITILFIVAMFLSFAAGMLQYYAIISLGQRARKNRILAAVGWYFLFSFVGRILSTFGMIFINETQLFTWVYLLPYLEHIYIQLAFAIVASGVLSALFYSITHYTIRHKLNLE